MNARTRTWIYRVAGSAVPLFVAYGLLDEDKAPLWLALAAAALTGTPSVLALRNITPDEEE